jgi:hypothetical protein
LHERALMISYTYTVCLCLSLRMEQLDSNLMDFHEI